MPDYSNPMLHKKTMRTTACGRWLSPAWWKVGGGSVCAAGLLAVLCGPIENAAPPAPATPTAPSEPARPSGTPPAIAPAAAPPVVEAADLPTPAEKPAAPMAIVESGTPIGAHRDIQALFLKAGVRDPVARKVILAVSEREGGFDAVNTVDSALLSVGCMQFTTGREAHGYKLVDVLARMRRDEEARCRRHKKRRNEFQVFFRDQGIDVRDGHLWVADPKTGEPKTAAEAVDAVRSSRALINAFRWAGLHSRAFQIAQLDEAYRTFYLADQPFRLPVAEARAPGAKRAARHFYGPNALRSARTWAAEHAPEAPPIPDGTPHFEVRRLPDLTGRYADVFTSEAGKAALMDRAVQFGVQGARREIDMRMVALMDGQAPDLRALRLQQKELVARVKNRIDVLNDRRFGQPWTPPAPEPKATDVARGDATDTATAAE